MKARKRLLLIIPNLDFGGAQESFTALVNELAAEHEVTSVVFNRHNQADYRLGNTLVDLNIPAGKSIFSKIYLFFKRVKKVAKLKRTLKIEVSISFLEGADYVNVLSRQQEKVILSIRGSRRYDPSISGWLGWIRHRLLIPVLYNRADHIVSINEGVKNELVEYYKIHKPIITIYNGYDFESILSQAKEHVEARFEKIFEFPVVINHGRLAPEKGLDRFLGVVSQCCRKGVSFKVVLIGDGVEKKRLVELCRELTLNFWIFTDDTPEPDLDAVVYFLGYQANPHKYLKKASVFVLPSLHEGFGNSLAEAMVCGVPVISSDCPYSPREILMSGSDKSLDLKPEHTPYGLLVPSWENPDAKIVWAEALDQLITNKNLREHYAAAGQRRIMEFNRKSMMNLWRSVILD